MVIIKYKLMLACNGGMQIMDNGARCCTDENSRLWAILGTDITEAMDNLAISDAKVTITIEPIQDNE